MFDLDFSICFFSVVSFDVDMCFSRFSEKNGPFLVGEGGVTGNREPAA